MIKVVRHKLDVLDFGKHKDKTVRWVIEHDPSYIIWLNENKICEIPEEIVEEAQISDANQSPPEDWFWTPD